MDILETNYIRKPVSVTFGNLFFFLFLGLGLAFGTAFAKWNFFTSAFAYLSMSMTIYYLVQLKAVSSAYSQYKKTRINMNKILFSTGLYWVFSIALFIPFISLVIPSVKLISSPYSEEGLSGNVLTILEFAKRYSPSPEIFNYFNDYGIFSIVVPFVLIASFLLCFFSWLYIRKMRNYHYIELEEFKFQKEQKIKRNNELKEHKSYKWS